MENFTNTASWQKKDILELFPVITLLQVPQINLLRHLSTFLSTGKIACPFLAWRRTPQARHLLHRHSAHEDLSASAFGQKKTGNCQSSDRKTTITEHDATARLKFSDVKHPPPCLCDTPLLQCHLQEVPLHEILYFSVYIGIMLIGFSEAHKDTLWDHYQTVNWFAGISVSCVISLGRWIYDYLWPSCIVPVLHSPWMQARISGFT